MSFHIYADTQCLRDCLGSRVMERWEGGAERDSQRHWWRAKRCWYQSKNTAVLRSWGDSTVVWDLGGCSYLMTWEAWHRGRPKGRMRGSGRGHREVCLGWPFLMRKTTEHSRASWACSVSVKQGTDAGLTLELRVTCQGLQRDPEGGKWGKTLVFFEGGECHRRKEETDFGAGPF